jgi:hypothetical protein
MTADDNADARQVTPDVFRGAPLATRLPQDMR